MNRHELIDVATISVSGLLLGNSRFFSRSASSIPIGEAVSGAVIDLEDIRTGSVQDVSVSTPLGEFQTAYLVTQ